MRKNVTLATIALLCGFGCAQTLPPEEDYLTPGASSIGQPPDLGGGDWQKKKDAYCATIAHADCDHNPANGCEVDIGGDVNNCGACGHVCGNLPHAAKTNCTSGHCKAVCHGDYADCDGNPDNGCETAIMASDPLNCGGCGFICTKVNAIIGANTFCQRGLCVTACDVVQDQADPDERYPICSNRCVGADNYADNCGGCGHKCTADAACIQARCQTCSMGTTRCGNKCVDKQTDMLNCGICGNRCDQNAKCVNGECVVNPDGGM